MTHLIVVGSDPPGVASSEEHDEIAAAVAAAKSTDVHLARASSLAELITLVGEIRNRHGLIDVLDIVDHGRAGCQMIGRDVMLASDDDYCTPLKGELTARSLAGHLHPHAHLRLLGCRTATDDDGLVATSAAGRLMLYKTARALGARRVVFGTIRATTVNDFSDAGYLLPNLEDEILCSSLAALDGDPPAYSERRIKVGLLRGERCA